MGRTAMAGAVLALVLATEASAQRVVQPGPGASFPPPGPAVRPSGTVVHPPLPPAPVQPVAGRWGSKVGGRWWGGANAPGGWASYRAPYRGYVLPRYWVAPRFYVSDWNTYGFAAPGAGQYWSRYYDDAVLIDGRGQVVDTRPGVDWDRYDGGYRDEIARRDGNGVAGAAVGAVVGGVAGNVIAGRGNRLGGTLIGAGVGAAAGYAIGSSADRRRVPPPPPPGPGWREPLPTYDEMARHDRQEHGRYERGPAYPPAPWVSPDGRTTVTVTTSGGPPVVYAPAYGYGGVTTITVQVAPMVTTTTTEIVEDNVTWTRPIVRKVYRKRLYRTPTKLLRRR